MLSSDHQIREITQPDAWDRFVLSRKRSAFCHQFNFSRVIEETYHHRPVYLGAFERSADGREELSGILPLFGFKRLRGRPRMVSIPYFDTAGILARDTQSRGRLLAASARLCRRHQYSGLEVRQNAPLDPAQLHIGNVPAQVFSAKTGMVIDLPGSRETMFAAFPSKLRSQIRKGRKNGLTYQIGKTELLDAFYRVFSRNMRDLGSPVHSRNLFRAVFKYFKDDAFICVVYFRSEPAAASFMIRFKQRLSNPWASSIRKYRSLNANMFLYWQMIGFACDLGMNAFDMGRSSLGAPTYTFKKQWGPVETPIFWYGWNFANNGKKLFGETLSIPPWKKLPLPVANLSGPVVRKYISL